MNNTTIAQVNKALKARGNNERLTRGRGYYYFRGVEACMWRESAVYVSHVAAFTVQEWLDERDRLARRAWLDEPHYTDPQENDGPARLSMMLPRIGNRRVE